MVSVGDTGYYKLIDSRDSRLIRGYYNERGEQVDELDVMSANRSVKFEDLEQWRDYGYVKKEQDGSALFYDLDKHAKVKVPMSDIYYYDRDYFYALKGDNCALIDAQGKEAYQAACKEQRIAAKIGDTPLFTTDKSLFYTNSHGKKVKYQCESAESIGQGKFIVRKAGKTGVVKLAIE